MHKTVSIAKWDIKPEMNKSQAEHVFTTAHDIVHRYSRCPPVQHHYVSDCCGVENPMGLSNGQVLLRPLLPHPKLFWSIARSIGRSQEISEFTLTQDMQLQLKNMYKNEPSNTAVSIVNPPSSFWNCPGVHSSQCNARDQFPVNVHWKRCGCG